MSDIVVTPRRRHAPTNRHLAWLFVATAFVVIVVLFVADNFVMVRVRLLTLDGQVRLAWVMLSTLLTGMVLGGLGGWFLGRGRR